MFIKHCNQSGEIVYVTEIRKKRIQMAALDGARRRLFIDCTGIGIAVSWVRGLGWRQPHPPLLIVHEVIEAKI